MNCVFCNREISKGGSGNDILHHTTPKCIVKRSWVESKEVSPRIKELLVKSRIPLCKHCHKVFHSLTHHITELIKHSEIPDVPPDDFINILRGADTKYGTRYHKYDQESGLTEAEDAAIREKLRRLGYIE